MLQVKHIFLLDLQQFNQTISEEDNRIGFDDFINNIIGELHDNGMVTVRIEHISNIDNNLTMQLSEGVSMRFLDELTKPETDRELHYLFYLSNPKVAIHYNHKL